MGSGKDKKHEKKRKHKKDDKKEKSSKKYKTSSDDALGRMNMEAAAAFMEALCEEHPALAGDLLGILKMVESGEAVVIGGIENTDIRSKLERLFPLMGLAESGPGGAYSKHKVAKRTNLRDRFGSILTRFMDKKNEAPAEDAKRPMPMGPQRPPTLPPPPATYDDDDDDGVCVGPVLPGMAGFREASAEVEAEMQRRADALEKEQWNRVRGITTDAPTTKPVLEREEWMLSLPNDPSIKDALGGLGDLTGRKFRSREKDERDDSWFASPEERQRALREKSQMDLLGYVPGGATVRPAAKEKEEEETFIAPQPRLGKSLLEAHQEKIAAATAHSGGEAPAKWDRYALCKCAVN
ncbi:hypothetical protein SPRG_10623 [Saprolegnia parasitica CBS 223.65]|uniref:Uncharacterized protein n=1 Tax=Saprolegnia parasitica (strain CBS 223.65) TaxID=695850 RepID=A0A067C0C6_SAPPC|nr:hypothetical protein SPRG_10623 [Saprolegnia parasitica CBS 223.65]KDO24194.1 hypothetical protein SPRG_10623 [Saprolegnia parasitica CBS 223.65]|eukprot:XP_012205138.1 hypothetical protein SPRG_10623 [Saprolegnia parasitica CBS 223.65]